MTKRQDDFGTEPVVSAQRRNFALGWLDSSEVGSRDLSGYQRVVVLHPYSTAKRDGQKRCPQASLTEAVNLTAAIKLNVVVAECILLRRTVPATLFGSGQIKHIASLIEQEAATIVMIDYAVSPIQQRNLEKAWNVKVIDRTGLILEIFGERAQSRAGVLQVELAHLSYQQSRLVRSWTHLERQRGGFGFLGGPGETQIETDRRLIRDRIARLKSELAEVERTRLLHREQRQRRNDPIVALVGYTNAGKSTLFNRLSGATVMAEDMLFATLDPTMRGIDLDKYTHIIISDTVGFISNLPTQLVAAFKATLDEVRHADILLHVRDCSHPDTDAQYRDVIDVLKAIGIDTESSSAPIIIDVLNKFDLLNDDEKQSLQNQSEHKNNMIAVSALTGIGVSALIACLTLKLAENRQVYELDVPLGSGKKLAWLHAHGEILAQTQDDLNLRLSVRLKSEDINRFRALE